MALKPQVFDFSEIEKRVLAHYESYTGRMTRGYPDFGNPSAPPTGGAGGNGITWGGVSVSGGTGTIGSFYDPEAGKMTKQHFKALAEAVRRVQSGVSVELNNIEGYHPLRAEVLDAILEVVTAQIAWACAQSNPKFDSLKFYAAARPDKAERPLPRSNKPRTLPRFHEKELMP